VKTTLSGALTLRKGCLTDEMQIGSFNGQVLQFSGINVQIVDGSGDTAGPTDGRGNLIIGYNEANNQPKGRTGSHNVLIGPEHTYSSFGGLVAGGDNAVSGEHASVCGGGSNTASGLRAAVSGGFENEASGQDTAISGGVFNIASGGVATVSGGANRSVSDQHDWRAGGLF
jgi:hypothetical protein